jgi:Transposase DDE domain
MRKAYQSDLSAAEWGCLAGHFPAPKATGRPKKKVKGRKRHILVDIEGFVLKARIHSAKVMDHDGIKTLLEGAEQAFPRLSNLWVDAGYRGEDKGVDWALRRPWAGVWIWWSVRKCPPQKRF